jgi:hypothetical protein
LRRSDGSTTMRFQIDYQTDTVMSHEPDLPPAGSTKTVRLNAVEAS